ncbi:hypothetical protein ADL22_16255 [Streptomyces sp. NRRL F-4489]|uniref:PepSY domain-containing protein n=1 Tax=Streptomyces sp. NRRL F-4489 TaxID=1609095 RepID=UPI00074A3C13|nr:PepSY domain-containing protein [Streptomyces sp. NRRL F-4489]KUL38823.1 hypothetical protein ADL22_16255 [Streptomyces sp. NRRL F-4489]
MATSRIRRAFTGRRRWLAAGAAAAVLAAGGTATAVAVTGATDGGTDGGTDARAGSSAAGPADIGRQRAVDAARTVVSGGRVVSVEQDHDHGTRVWEVEIHTAGGVEHEVDVSMADGKVLSHSVDHDDRDDHGHEHDHGHDDD